MKVSLFLLVMVLAAGCSHEQFSPSATSSGPSEKAAETSAPAEPQMQYPSHAGEPAGMYFETRRDGKTYVTGYVPTATLIRNGEVPPYVIEKKNVGPDAQTVYFEDDGKGLAQRLEKDYLSQQKK